MEQRATFCVRSGEFAHQFFFCGIDGRHRVHTRTARKEITGMQFEARLCAIRILASVRGLFLQAHDDIMRHGVIHEFFKTRKALFYIRTQFVRYFDRVPDDGVCKHSYSISLPRRRHCDREYLVRTLVPGDEAEGLFGYAELAGEQLPNTPVRQVAFGGLTDGYLVPVGRKSPDLLLFGPRNGIDADIHSLHFSTVFASIFGFDPHLGSIVENRIFPCSSAVEQSTVKRQLYGEIHTENEVNSVKSTEAILRTIPSQAAGSPKGRPAEGVETIPLREYSDIQSAEAPRSTNPCKWNGDDIVHPFQQ